MHQTSQVTTAQKPCCTSKCTTYTFCICATVCIIGATVLFVMDAMMNPSKKSGEDSSSSSTNQPPSIYKIAAMAAALTSIPLFIVTGFCACMKYITHSGTNLPHAAATPQQQTATEQQHGIAVEMSAEPHTPSHGGATTPNESPSPGSKSTTQLMHADG